MARERYPGERRGLGLFLENLLPIARQALGEDALLCHAIRRALHSGDLDHLRHARTIFNHLPRTQRRELSTAVVESGIARLTAAAGEPDPPDAPEEPAPFVSFEAPPPGHDAPSVSLTHEILPPDPVRVIVAPGTLPRTAADSLRRIVDMIEQDRRLLSERYWRAKGTGEPQAATGQSESDRG